MGKSILYLNKKKKHNDQDDLIMQWSSKIYSYGIYDSQRLTGSSRREVLDKSKKKRSTKVYL